jgi:hypothetical protein
MKRKFPVPAIQYNCENVILFHETITLNIYCMFLKSISHFQPSYNLNAKYFDFYQSILLRNSF